MKKITTLLLLLVAALVVVMPTFADEELVDIYPYDDPGALYGPTTPFTLVGDSNWDMELLGHRYHFVRGGVRFAHLWTDADADGIYAPTDYPALSWNAFAVMTINDGLDEIEMSTNSARTDITSVVQRIYSYYNEDGELSMVEDHFFQYYIHNDGADATDNADWRLATEAEITAFEAAADPLVDTPNTRFSPVRIMRDDADADGYVLEPIGYLTWRNPDLSALPEAEQSLLVDWHPNNVVIPAGWTVVSFGTNDRGAYSATDFVKSLVPTFADAEAPVMNAVHTHPNPEFSGLTGHDDDAASAGVQMIVEFNEVGFDLPNDVSVKWTKMYDEDGFIVNEEEKLDYTVSIYDVADYNSAEEEHVPTVLETITFTYDAVEDAYTPDKAISVVDSSVFGAGYIAVYAAEHPEDGLTEIEVDIAIGVLPPRFENVKNRFADESVYVDLLGDITANDGYGNDLTSSITVTPPAGFNMYNPKPGAYNINLEFTHNVFIAGDPTVLTIGTTDYSIDLETVNAVANVSVLTYGRFAVFTESEAVNDVGSGYGSVFLYAAADGTLKEWFDRYNWNHMTESGVVVKDEAQFNAWRSGLTLAEGEFVVGMHGGTNTSGLRNLAFGHPIDFVLGTEDFETDIVTSASYQLTIDDKTAPQVVVVNNNYTIEADAFADAEAAILANVVAIDNFDLRSQLSIYVVDNDGLAVANGKLIVGTYSVTVAAEDRAGNFDEVTFTIVVKAAKPTQEEVDQQVDDKVDEVETKIPADTMTPDEVQAAIDDALASSGGVSVLTAVLMSLGAALLSFGGAALLFFLKKK